MAFTLHDLMDTFDWRLYPFSYASTYAYEHPEVLESGEQFDGERPDRVVLVTDLRARGIETGTGARLLADARLTEVGMKVPAALLDVAAIASRIDETELNDFVIDVETALELVDPHVEVEAVEVFDDERGVNVTMRSAGDVAALMSRGPLTKDVEDEARCLLAEALVKQYFPEHVDGWGAVTR